MLQKLEMKFSDFAGNPISLCTVTKCHKREGDPVHYGDPLFDLRVSQVLVPQRASLAWRQGNRLSTRPSEIADLVGRQLEGDPLARGEGKMADGDIAAPRHFWRRVIATDRGFMRKLHAQEGSHPQIGDLMALLSTGECDSIGTACAPIHIPAFRVVTCPTPPNDVLDTMAARMRVRGTEEHRSKNTVIFWSEEGREERRIGIFAKGGCDLPSIMECRPLIQRVLKGTCCIHHGGSVADARNDLLLQTLRTDLPGQLIDEAVDKLRLQPTCFQPGLFRKSFVVDGPSGPETFPTTVVILSNGSDLTRVLYRHRQYGFLVDPGGGWLDERSLDDPLKDLSAIAWFRRNFISIGRVTVEKYQENLSRVIQHIRDASSAHILIFNNLTAGPNSPVHNYQSGDPETAVRGSRSSTRYWPVRSLEFKLALTEVSRKLDVPIIDVDRIVKKVGIRTERDIYHFQPKVASLVAEQIFGILGDLGVF
jgi:hypothetical protein